MATSKPSAIEHGPAPTVQPPSMTALNVPNTITSTRLLLSLVLFWLIGRGHDWWIAAVVFLVAAATDMLDGAIARRYGMVTVLGRILDPFVDKIIVCGAFLFLVPWPDSGVGPWLTLIVLAREMIVTSLRSFLESRGRDFSANWAGKIKMVLQCVGITASLVFLQIHSSGLLAENQLSRLAVVRDVLLWLAAFATVYSGAIYVYRAWQALRAD